MDLTTKGIRRGSTDYSGKHNYNPVPFVWTAEADKIIAKIGRSRVARDKARSS